MPKLKLKYQTDSTLGFSLISCGGKISFSDSYQSTPEFDDFFFLMISVCNSDLQENPRKTVHICIPNSRFFLEKYFNENM
jgi:hypothetical protein